MNKSLLCMLLVGLFASIGDASNTINWSNVGTSNFPIYEHDGTTALASGTDAVGYLVQLIYDSGNDGPSPVDLSNDYGVGDGDQYAAYAWIGKGVPPPQYNGLFVSLGFDNIQPNGSSYFIRAWEGASKQIGTGFIPDAPDYYGNSQIFTVQGNTDPSSNDEFFMTSSFSTVIAVPEPTTIALAFAGLGLLVVRRFRKKKD